VTGHTQITLTRSVFLLSIKCHISVVFVFTSVQFVIAEDGACGLCYEHSPSEGIAVVQLIEHLLAYMYATNLFFKLSRLLWRD